MFNARRTMAALAALAILSAGQALAASAPATPAPTPAPASPPAKACETPGTKGDMPVTAPAIPGQLTVAVTLPAPTWWNGAGPDSIKDGFEYCLAQNIAWRAGLDKLVVVNMPWRQVTSGEAKGFDLAMSEIEATAERKKTLAFSAPYFPLDFGVLVKPGTAIDETSIKQLRLGVRESTPAADFAAGTLKPASVKTYAEYGELFHALHTGEIDAAIVEASVALAEQGLEAGSLVTAGRYVSGRGLAAVYPKDTANAAAFDKIIGALVSEGTSAALAKKFVWNLWGLDPTIVPVFKP